MFSVVSSSARLNVLARGVGAGAAEQGIIICPAYPTPCHRRRREVLKSAYIWLVKM